MASFFQSYKTKTKIWKWKELTSLHSLFPAGFKGHIEKSEEITETETEMERVSLKKRNKTWAKLIHKLYPVDPMICSKCSSEMKVVAVITNPKEIRKTVKHQNKKWQI